MICGLCSRRNLGSRGGSGGGGLCEGNLFKDVCGTAMGGLNVRGTSVIVPVGSKSACKGNVLIS